MSQDIGEIVEGALKTARVELGAGRFEAVVEICTKVLALAPSEGLAYRILQEAHVRRGDLGAAGDVAGAYVQACADDAGAWFSLADIRLRTGLVEAAEEAYLRGLSLAPGHLGATVNLAIAKLRLGALGDAMQITGALVEREPSCSPAWRVLGATALSLSLFERSVEAHERLVALEPSDAAGWVGLGLSRKNLGQLPEARDAFDHALELKPGNAVALFGRHLSLPIVHETEAGVVDAREGFEKGLVQVEAALDLATPEARAGALEACLSMTNFFLHYQGYDDLELQKRHGALLQSVVGACFPDFTKPMPRRPVAGRIKIGFISANFHWHSIFKTHGGFITQLDRERFEITTIHLGAKFDGATQQLQDASDHFFHWPDFDPSCVQRIASFQLDVIVYPDLGMEPLTQTLATLRLAPTQCNAGGHPITSGLSTMDYFLSSELMEPPGADGHYSEELVRLPSLFTAYPRPQVDGKVLPTALKGREETTRFVCLQSLYKLLPQFDDVFAQILERVPDSELCFIVETSARVTSVFSARLSAAMQARGLDFSERVVMLPRMSQEAFYGLASSATVILDSFFWSGNNSSMEASWLGKPIVTWGGPMMRGRHTMAILQRMGLDELIAGDLAEYVDLASRLATDSEWRAAVEAVIGERKGLLFEDSAPVRGVEGFLCELLGRP
ncbi:MAG: tetratricopeptide repeat protein [Myxococcota bacterium]|nr:tetratricopeptide repeat protein [Myxococcota bacterium]